MNYNDEVKKRWGDTEAYREFERRAPGDDAAKGLMGIFSRLGELKGLPPEDSAVQAEISRLQKYITGNYYTCTDEILYGLGEMYSADPRFKESIDNAGGEGTASFVTKAIRTHFKKKRS